jgi:hypothetical protein
MMLLSGTNLFKGIVSRDFDVIFLFHWMDMKFVIRPDQVIIHFNDVLKLKFEKKICLRCKDPSESGTLDLLPSGGFFVLKQPTLALHGINGDSVGNYQLMDRESTGGIVIPPGITSS